MAFALATGQHISRLAASNVVESHGYGKVQRSQGHPGWLLVADQMSPIGRSPDPRSPWQVVCDGYLANHEEIAASLPDARELRKNKHPNELIAALLDQAGPDAMFRLVGNFAIVAANEKDGSVVAMRDRMGGRTLYRLNDAHPDLLIASRSAWVQMLSNRPFQPDPKFLTSFFALQPAPPPSHSAFAGVRELLPGERLSLKQGKAQSIRPELDLDSDFDYSRPGDCVARFRELFQQAVAATLPPSGDVACMLSGGLDSGPTAVVADQVLNARGDRINVTSWQLDDYPSANEREWIELIATRLSSPANLLDGNTPLPFDLLDQGQIGRDLPHFNAYRPQVLACYSAAQQFDCEVILNGNAGDEIYAPIHLLGEDRLKRRQWGPIWRDLVSLWRSGGLRSALAYPGFRFRPRFTANWLGSSVARPPSWLGPKAAQLWEPFQVWPPELMQARYPAYSTQLLGHRMAFGRAHEAEFPARYGVDRRDPFQNEALAKFMLHAPVGLSHRRGNDKWVMRRASENWLPEQARKKARTGLLHEFYRAGLRKNRAKLTSFVSRCKPGQEDWLDLKAVTASIETPGKGPDILPAYLIGFSLWEHIWSGESR